MKKISYHHKSVLLDEVIKHLNIKPNGTYVDCTLGGGGHSKAILKKLNKGQLIAFDKDQEAIAHNQKLLKDYPHNFQIINDDFINLAKYIKNLVDGIILDAGVSSHQIDQKDRGFSFQKDGPLDMRMNQKQKLTAYHIVNDFTTQELTTILWKYGEERFAKRIAHAITLARQTSPITTTLELVKIIKSVIPKKQQIKKHPAKKTFQALRIATNNELVALEKFVLMAPSLLTQSGRILVITFHSLEDKIIKHAFKNLTTPPKTPREIPHLDQLKTNYTLVVKKPITPTLKEQKHNPRSKSAKLRIILKKGDHNE